ncbi:hypothetical protein [Streptomyces sp. Inha503]|uniref:hypothetical protein n=1 Tax=Streptomyces sp. Inha503 TaxID=3383314 RepID=UPI0039A08E9B
MRQVTPGAIDKTATHAFMNGCCGGLAIALHDATGWPIIAATVNNGLALHYMVRTPDGQLLDIEGAHPAAHIVVDYELDADDGIVTLAEQTREYVWSSYRDELGEPIPMNVVRSFVGPVLKLAGAPAA